MEKKIKFLKSAFVTGKTNRKNLLLSVVALVLVLMMMVVSTFSWIETTSSIQLYTPATEEGKGEIDTRTDYLANMSVGDGNNAIDLTNYFRASGNVHLAPALSPDGVNFYFKKLDRYSDSEKTKPLYRHGNINDKNVNYISFSFKVTAKDSYQAFYFASEPKIKIGDTEISGNDVRFSITVGDSTTIYSNTQSSDEKITINGTEYSSVVRSFENYVSNTATASLFELENNTTEIVTISMWLNDKANADYTGKEVDVSNFKLVSSAQKAVDCKLLGYGNDWSTGWEMVYAAQNKVYVEKQIPKGYFEFKIRKDGYWYGCNDTSIYNETASDISLETDTNNIKFYAYGGTYKFIFDLESHGLQIIDDKNTTVVLAFDATSKTWVAEASPVIWLEDVDNNNYGYQMTKISSYVWMAEVPTKVVNTNFKRNNPNNNSETWNYWNNKNRNNCRVFVVTGDGNDNGSWK